jgi:hypothetical protein
VHISVGKLVESKGEYIADMSKGGPDLKRFEKEARRFNHH